MSLSNRYARRLLRFAAITNASRLSPGASDRNGVSAIGDQCAYRFCHPRRHDRARRRQLGHVVVGELVGDRRESVLGLSRAEPCQGANGVAGRAARRHELPARRMTQAHFLCIEAQPAVGTRREIDEQHRILRSEAEDVGDGGAAGTMVSPHNAESEATAFSMLGARGPKRVSRAACRRPGRHAGGVRRGRDGTASDRPPRSFPCEARYPGTAALPHCCGSSILQGNLRQSALQPSFEFGPGQARLAND